MEGAFSSLSFFPFSRRVLTLFASQASEIPAEDLASGDGQNTGCLISEVVTPGFDFDDHKFLSQAALVELFGGDENAKGVEELRSYVRNE